MRLKNSIDYKRFPEPSRGDWTRFTIHALSAQIGSADTCGADFFFVTPMLPQFRAILGDMKSGGLNLHFRILLYICIMDRIVKVILLLDVSGEFDRKLLRGIVRYSQEHGPWQFFRMPPYFRWDADGEKHLLEWAKKRKADAIIGRWNSPQAPLLKKLGIPIVLQNYQTRSKTYSILTGDYLGTGRMAAQFFRKRMFTHFAYFGLKGVIWSEERCQGFTEELGQEVSVFEATADDIHARRGVTRWLHDLPKPTALFCCDDSHALLISETCKLEGIDVPEEIAILGVDNDELYCAISDPPISSIELNEEQGGYLICSLLHQQILTGSNEPFTVTISPKCIIERQSTDRHNIRDSYVAEESDTCPTTIGKTWTWKGSAPRFPCQNGPSNSVSGK